MARYQVQGPDGQVHLFEGPDGATPEQVLSVAQRMFSGQPTREQRIAAQEAADRKLYAPTNGMSGPEKFLAGAGKAFVDIGRGTGQLLGLVSREDVADSRKLDAPLMDTGAGKAGNIAGTVAALAPTAFIPGANTIAGGAAIGAATGLLQPSTSTRETLTNVGFGGAAGAVVPTAVRGVKVLNALAAPLYGRGQEKIIGTALNRAAGADAPAVANRLAASAEPFVGPSQGVPRTVMGELVPGSVPTVGQAAENAGVASLERAATAANPNVTNAVSDLMKQQNAARVGVLSDMAGSDGARAFAAANRDATAEQLYGAARRLGVDPAKLTPEALQNIAEFSQRVPDSVLNTAKELAKIKGEPMADATSITGMHWIKQALDGEIGVAQRAGNATRVQALMSLKSDLLQGMDNLSPAYGAARNVYSAMSRPVNQMDTAQAIADKSINKLTGNLQPSAYANALADGTARKATSFSGATLENTMEPAQMNALNSLLADVQRSNAAQNSGRGVGSDTVQKLAYTNLLDQAGVPTFLRNFAPAEVTGNIAARGADALYARANREISEKLAQVMLDPAKAADLMRSATPAQRRAILDLLGKSASGLAISAPPVINALQQ